MNQSVVPNQVNNFELGSSFEKSNCEKPCEEVSPSHQEEQKEGEDKSQFNQSKGNDCTPPDSSSRDTRQVDVVESMPENFDGNVVGNNENGNGHHAKDHDRRPRNQNFNNRGRRGHQRNQRGGRRYNDRGRPYDGKRRQNRRNDRGYRNNNYQNNGMNQNFDSQNNDQNFDNRNNQSDNRSNQNFDSRSNQNFENRSNQKFDNQINQNFGNQNEQNFEQNRRDDLVDESQSEQGGLNDKNFSGPPRGNRYNRNNNHNRRHNNNNDRNNNDRRNGNRGSNDNYQNRRNFHNRENRRHGGNGDNSFVGNDDNRQFNRNRGPRRQNYDNRRKDEDSRREVVAKNQCFVKGSNSNKNPWGDKKMESGTTNNTSSENPWVCAGEKENEQHEQLSYDDRVLLAVQLCASHFKTLDPNFSSLCQEKLGKFADSSEDLQQSLIPQQPAPPLPQLMYNDCAPQGSQLSSSPPCQINEIRDTRQIPINAVNQNHIGQSMIAQSPQVYGQHNLLPHPSAQTQPMRAEPQHVPQNQQISQQHIHPHHQIQTQAHQMHAQQMHAQAHQMQAHVAYHQTQHMPQQIPMQSHMAQGQNMIPQPPQIPSQTEYLQNVPPMQPFQSICLNTQNSTEKMGDGKIQKSKLRSDAPSFQPQTNSSPVVQNNMVNQFPQEPRVPLYNTAQIVKGQVLLNLSIETPSGRQMLIHREGEDLVNTVQVFCQTHDLEQYASSVLMNASQRIPVLMNC